MSEGPFTRKTVVWLAVLGGVSLVVFFLLLIGAEPGEVEYSVGGDAFSRSAVGHRAFVSLLRRLDVPVVLSRYASGRRAGRSGVLLVLEPGDRPDHAGAEALGEMLGRAERWLLVLPKWTPRAKPVPEDSVEAVLRAAGIGGTLVRSDPRWHDSAPELAGFAQLVGGSALTPVIAADEGLLVGRVPGTAHYVLTDPDLLANHGLHRGGNALLAVALVEELRAGARPVVVDETLHGYFRRPRLWSALFGFPLVLALLHGFLVLGLLLWAGSTRFGPPRDEDPAFARGKGVLLENTAALLGAGPHDAVVLERYLKGRQREVEAKLGSRAAAGLPDWLAARGLGRRSGILATARAAHRWKKEMLHGS